MIQRSASKVWGKRLLIGALAATGALYATADYLFRLTLEPRWKHSMLHGESDGAQLPGLNPSHTLSLDTQEEAEAADWFEDAKRGVSLNAADGTRLHGWMLDPDCANPQRHLYAICCHGYSGEPAEMAKYAHRFARLGFRVLTPASRAHELSGGHYIGMGWLERHDLMRWIDSILSEDPEARILLFGISMGASTIMMTVGDRHLPENVVAAVCDCGFHDVWHQFIHSGNFLYHLPVALIQPVLEVMSLISRHRAGYDFHEASCGPSLRQASIPMLFIHGDADKFVDPACLDENFRDCASPFKRKLLIPEANHTMSASTDPKRYWNAVTTFVRQTFDLK
ncbi:alpha/beta hydrolase [Bifidobacterium sp. ESL0790]|uniref:alpha/beta hydrolase n=1 Tax=Bifidobacterium sp. ESL0790 TaxID=2983233 RepID=UPI0023F989CD|nr:alpha/beta hydrolase [Bifidobacterium sp. ESL0790]WEV73111.1 alpha/beta hydrolase [Bifidobacterium sp. ESL0790]